MIKFKSVVSVIVAFGLFSSVCFGSSGMPATDYSGYSPIKESLKTKSLNQPGVIKVKSSQSSVYTIPNNLGTLTSNVWRSTFGSQSGNTLQWNYQVSAKYTGKLKVARIRTSWQAAASMRNSATISLGLGDTVSAGAGSAWLSTCSVTKYWENTNGATSADYSSNMYVAPQQDYRSNTISLANTATVQLQGDPRVYSYVASV